MKRSDWLVGEIGAWVREGLISPAQGQALRARSVGSSGGAWWRLGFAVIGGVLCLAGVSLLIASNWATIPPLVKLAGVLTLLIGGTVVGVESQCRGWNRAIEECGCLFAAVMPLLGLMLISQIFHLSGDTSTLLATWGLAIVPMVLLSGSGAAFAVGLMALYAWLGFWLGEREHRLDSGGVFALYAGLGAMVALGSQLWGRVGRPQLRSMGEFIGAFTVAGGVWLVGCVVDPWFVFWLLLFLGALAWIWMNAERGRVHQVNLAFGVVALLILSTFLRLVGTMAQTGVIFLGGGVVLLVSVGALNVVRRRIVKKIP